MKKIFILTFFALMGFYGNAAVKSAVLLNPVGTPELTNLDAAFSQMSPESILKLTPKQYRAMTGKKLSVKQVIALKAAQSQLKKQEFTTSSSGNPNKWGMLSLIFNGIGLLAFIFLGPLALPFSILAVIFGFKGLKKDSNNTMAIIGLIVGGIGILLELLSLVIAGIYLISIF